jgi:hypothetical protein
MFLAIMLIIVAVLVVYNEINKTMNIAEIALLVVALIAIVRASLNYINIDDSFKNEGFTNKLKSRKAGVKSKDTNHMDDLILESNKSKEYFDTDESSIPTKFNTNQKESLLDSIDSLPPALKALEKNKINQDAVKQVNSILGIKSPFKNVTSSTKANKVNPANPANPANPTGANTNYKISGDTTGGGIDSVFAPQIKIGKGSDFDNSINIGGLGTGINAWTGLPSLASGSAGWGSNDNMTFKNTMKPTSDLWKSDLDYMDNSTNWSQSLNDYNEGKWNPKLYGKPSDYIDYYNPSAYGMSTPKNTAAQTTMPQTTMPQSAVSKSGFDNIENSNSNESDNSESMSTKKSSNTLDEYGNIKKLCGAYDDLALDQAGNLTVKNYTQAKKWYPGYTYVPPVYWDVPQRHMTACQAPNPDARKLTGLVDRGLPLNVLELNPDGTYADTENTVSLTNVGSILPKFTYEETPFSKPYI